LLKTVCNNIESFRLVGGTNALHSWLATAKNRTLYFTCCYLCKKYYSDVHKNKNKAAVK